MATLARLTLRRLYLHPLRTLLSIGGVALAVALTFAVQIAGSASDGSDSPFATHFKATVRLEIVGRTGADLPATAIHIDEDPRLGIVESAALVERSVVVRRGSRALSVYLVGVKNEIVHLLAAAARRQFERSTRTGGSGIYASPALAEELRIGRGDSVVLDHAGEQRTLGVAGRLPFRDVADDLLVAATPFQWAQTIAETDGATRVLLAVRAGDQERVERAVERELGPAVDVRPVETQAKLLAQASATDRRGAALFSAVGILLGGLLAYVALHLSVAQRRREIATLRLAGVPDTPLVLALVVELLAITALGSATGLAAGGLLLSDLVSYGTSRLEQAFLITKHRNVDPSMALASVAVGALAMVAASIAPLRLLLSASPIEALDERARLRCTGPSLRRWMTGGALLGGLACTAIGAWLATASPSLGIVGVVGFFAGLVAIALCLTPMAFRGLARIARLLPPAAAFALSQLRETPQRTAPLVAGIALSVAAVLAVNGTAENIEDGASAMARGSFPTSDELWLSADRPHNDLRTVRLPPETLAAVRELPDLGSVTGFRSTFLDWEGRRIMAFAYDRPRLLNPKAVIDGDLVSIRRELAAGTGAVLSPELAQAADVRIGDRFAIPSPSGPRTYRLGGLITNYGWAPGTLGLARREFVSTFGHDTLTAIRVDPHSALTSAGRASLHALAEREGLRIQRSADAERQAVAAARDGLAQMRRIATIFTIATVLVVAVMLLTAVSQRIPLLAALVALGLTRPQLRRSIYAEACLLLGLGVTMGIAAGLLAQRLMVDVLGQAAGYPVLPGPAPTPVLLALASGLLSAAVAGAVAALATRQAAPRAMAYE